MSTARALKSMRANEVLAKGAWDKRGGAFLVFRVKLRGQGHGGKSRRSSRLRCRNIVCVLQLRRGDGDKPVEDLTSGTIHLEGSEHITALGTLHLSLSFSESAPVAMGSRSPAAALRLLTCLDLLLYYTMPPVAGPLRDHRSGICQSISGLPKPRRTALIWEKGLLPKKPLRADRGEGWTDWTTV